MTIWARVAAALAGLGVPVAARRMLAESGETLPDIYVVYSLVDGVGADYADDAETQRRYRVQVSTFARAGLVDLPNVVGAMLAADFTRGPERELPFGVDSQHFGLAQDFFYDEV